MPDILTEKEQEIVEAVIRALPQHLVVVKPVKVFTLEEGEAANIRFTATDGSFADLNRARIADEGESVEVLCKVVEEALQEQLESTLS